LLLLEIWTGGGVKPLLESPRQSAIFITALIEHLMHWRADDRAKMVIDGLMLFARRFLIEPVRQPRDCLQKRAQSLRNGPYCLAGGEAPGNKTGAAALYDKPGSRSPRRRASDTEDQASGVGASQLVNAFPAQPGLVWPQLAG
jgi:hypothetical protein